MIGREPAPSAAPPFHVDHVPPPPPVTVIPHGILTCKLHQTWPVADRQLLSADLKKRILGGRAIGRLLSHVEKHLPHDGEFVVRHFDQRSFPLLAVELFERQANDADDHIRGEP